MVLCAMRWHAETLPALVHHVAPGLGLCQRYTQGEPLHATIRLSFLGSGDHFCGRAAVEPADRRAGGGGHLSGHIAGAEPVDRPCPCVGQPVAQRGGPCDGRCAGRHQPLLDAGGGPAGGRQFSRSARALGKPAEPAVVCGRGAANGFVGHARHRHRGAALPCAARVFGHDAGECFGHAHVVGAAYVAVERGAAGHPVQPGGEHHGLHRQPGGGRHCSGPGGAEHPGGFVCIAVHRCGQAVPGGRLCGGGQRGGHGADDWPQDNPHPQPAGRGGGDVQHRPAQADH